MAGGGGWDLGSIISGVGERISQAANPWGQQAEQSERSFEDSPLGQWGQAFTGRFDGGWGSQVSGDTSMTRAFDQARNNDVLWWNAQQALDKAARPPATAAPAAPGKPTAPTATGGGTQTNYGREDLPYFNDIAQYIPEDLRNDPEFLRTLYAGAQAESGMDPNKIQHGYALGSGAGARGFWQFDMAGMGKPYLGNEQALLGPEGVKLQASQIIPEYAKNYRNRAASGLTDPAQIASWVAAQSERPLDYQNPNSAARQNYVQAYNQVQVANQAHTQVANANAQNGGQFNPSTPAIKQTLDWSCSATSAAWVLNSLGVQASEQSVIQGLGNRISSARGLEDASGSGLVQYFKEQGLEAQNGPVSFDQVAAMAGKSPMMIGSSGWYHWTGVAGVSQDGNSLILANPAPGYKGIGQTINRQQFAQMGGFNAVWINGTSTGGGNTQVVQPGPRSNYFRS